MSNLTLGLFQSSLMLYIPLSLAAAFGILFIPSLLVTGAKPEGVARAIGCYMLKTLGVILVAVSSMRIIYDLITMDIPDFPILAALALIFLLGLGIMVQQSRVLTSVDEASLIVPRLVFSHTCEISGALISLLATLSLVVTFIVNQSTNGWEMSSTMLLLGVTLMLLSSVHIQKRNKKASRAMKAKK